ncbi:Undecaprenyl-diphosphatase [Planctomycetales bacterium 10988]|nr:Undecaprenyl-diphosphatase [Planctomycetales bacterium 10988]
MEWWKLGILALVQGLTEFLPISSSGHLVIVEGLLFEHSDFFLRLSIALHAGTLVSILIYYHKAILYSVLQKPRVMGLIIAATIPTAIFGFTLKAIGEAYLESPFLAGCMLPITGLILIAAMKRPEGTIEYDGLTYLKAIVIGIAQSFALLPGISRSGTTIATGMALGLKPQAAGTFSFLIAIPAILGATVVEFLGSDASPAETSQAFLFQLTGAALFACVVGLFALKWLDNWLESRQLHYFAYWCIGLGFLVLIWQTYLLY